MPTVAYKHLLLFWGRLGKIVLPCAPSFQQKARSFSLGPLGIALGLEPATNSTPM